MMFLPYRQWYTIIRCEFWNFPHTAGEHLKTVIPVIRGIDPDFAVQAGNLPDPESIFRYITMSFLHCVSIDWIVLCLLDTFLILIYRVSPGPRDATRWTGGEWCGYPTGTIRTV